MVPCLLSIRRSVLRFCYVGALWVTWNGFFRRQLAGRCLFQVVRPPLLSTSKTRKMMDWKRAAADTEKRSAHRMTPGFTGLRKGWPGVFRIACFHLGRQYYLADSSSPTTFLLRCWSLMNSSICVSCVGRCGGPAAASSAGDGPRSGSFSLPSIFPTAGMYWDTDIHLVSRGCAYYSNSKTFHLQTLVYNTGALGFVLRWAFGLRRCLVELRLVIGTVGRVRSVALH